MTATRAEVTAVGIRVEHASLVEVQRVVDALLLAAADARTRHNDTLARAYLDLANDYGDAIDVAVPVPSGHPKAVKRHAGLVAS